MWQHKLLQVSFCAAITHIGKWQDVNWEKINIFFSSQTRSSSGTCVHAAALWRPTASLCRKNPQSPIWRYSPGTWDIQRRVTSPCLGSCPRPLLKRWGMEPSWSWIHRESLQGFHNPSGPDPDREKEREREKRESALSDKRPCRSLLTSEQLVN